MLLEALIISACVYGPDGCGPATSAYYEQSKDLKDFTKRLEKIGQNITTEHKWIVYAGTPLYAIAVRKPASILIYRGTTLNVDIWNKAVGLQWNY
jgi:hypothetical protein